MQILINQTLGELCNVMETHLTELTLTLLTVEYNMLGSPVCYQSSFIAIEIYICMTSMVMLSNTIEVSINIGLPLKGRAQVWLGHFWTLLGTLGNL